MDNLEHGPSDLQARLRELQQILGGMRDAHRRLLQARRRGDHGASEAAQQTLTALYTEVSDLCSSLGWPCAGMEDMP